MEVFDKLGLVICMALVMCPLRLLPLWSKSSQEGAAGQCVDVLMCLLVVAALPKSSGAMASLTCTKFLAVQAPGC